MKKIDFLFILIFIFFVSLLIVPESRTFIANSSTQLPYLMGFVKTAILATYGEMIGSRIGSGDYFKKTGLFYRFFVWGLLGMVSSWFSRFLIRVSKLQFPLICCQI